MRIRSLRLQMLLSLTLPLTALAGWNMYSAWHDAVTTAGLISDRTMLAAAGVIAERIRMADGMVDAVIPPSALGLFAGEAVDRIVYSVTGPHGELVAGDPDVPQPPAPQAGLQPVWFDAMFRSQPVRAVAIRQPLPDAGPDAAATVIVGSTRHDHDAMVARLWQNSMPGSLLMVLAAGLLSVIGLRTGLRPLLRFVAEVARRDARQLNALDGSILPHELQPLALALNGAFARVERQVAAQRRFIANAAHQLRTPLSVLKIQTGYGLRAESAEAKQEALQALDARIDATSRLVTQMLALARAEQGALLSRSPADLAAITREVLESCAMLAIDRRIDLGFGGGSEAVMVSGHPVLLQEMIANLVDNAIKYTPPGGSVTATAEADAAWAVVTVEDSGPGMPDDGLETSFERFFRASRQNRETPMQATEGSGLGLAIVREIAAAHGGSVTLANRRNKGGLVARVRLPLLVSPP